MNAQTYTSCTMHTVMHAKTMKGFREVIHELSSLVDLCHPNVTLLLGKILVGVSTRTAIPHRVLPSAET